MSFYRLFAYVILSLAVLLFIVLPSVLLGLIYSSSGSQWLVNTAKTWLPETVNFSRFDGRLADRFAFDQLRIDSAVFSASFDSVSVAWQPWSLLDSSLVIENLTLGSGEIRIRQGQTAADDNSPSSLDSISTSLPIAIDLKAFELRQSWFFINQLPQQQFAATASLKVLQSGQLTLRSLQLQHQYASISAEAQADLSFPFKHQLNTSLTLHSPDYPGTRLKLNSSGDMKNLQGQFDVRDSANINGSFSLKDVLQQASWQADLSINDTTLNDWLSAFAINGLEPLRLDGNVNLTGDAAQRVQIIPDLDVVYAAQDATMTGNITLEGQQLTLKSVTLASPERGELSINGRVDDLASPSIDLTASLKQVLYEQTQTTGKIALTGPLDRLEISTSTETQIEKPQSATINAKTKALLESSQLTLETIRITDTLTEGEISGSAKINWQQQIQVNANINGELLGKPFSLLTDVQYNTPYVDVSALELNWQTAHLSAKGRLSPGSKVSVKLDITDLAGLPLPLDASGELKLNADIEGDISSLWLDMKLNSKQLVVADTEFSNLALQLTGAPDNHDLTASLTAFATDWQLRTRNKLADSIVSIELQEWQVNHESLEPFSLNQATAIRYNWQRSNLNISDLCLQQAAENGAVCVAAQSDNGATELTSTINGLNLSLLNPFISNAPVTIDGRLTADSTASWNWQNSKLNSADVDISVEKLQLSGLDESITFDEFSASLAPNEDRFEARLLATANEIDFNTEGVLQLDSLSAGSSLTGSLESRLGDLGLLEVLSPAIASAKGDIKASLGLSGTLNSIQVMPNINANINELVLAETATAISDTQISLAATDASNNTFRLDADGMVGSGKFNLSGEFDVNSQQLKAQLNGQQLQLIDTPKLAVTVTPDIKVTLKDNRLSVTGDVIVPEAEITPPQLSNVQRSSSDVVIKQQQQPKGRALETFADISLTLGDKVNVDAYGFQGQLQGKLNIKQNNTGVARGEGEIGVKTGTYEVYGQELIIERGQLVYNGGPIGNPSLNLQVIRNLPKTTGNPERVGARVQGTLQEPTLDLFSNPPMPDASVLSYLMFGRAPNSPSESSNLELQAALLLTGDMTDSFTQGLKDTFGFDEVAIDSATSDVNDTSLYIGKYLTPRLYIKYGIGLVESTSSFFLRYQLTDHLWLESTSSTESQGGDLIYSIEK